MIYFYRVVFIPSYILIGHIYGCDRYVLLSLKWEGEENDVILSKRLKLHSINARHQ